MLVLEMALLLIKWLSDSEGAGTWLPAASLSALAGNDAASLSTRRSDRGLDSDAVSALVSWNDKLICMAFQ